VVKDDAVEQFYAKDRRVWRLWLSKHHRRGEPVWLVYYKKDCGTPSITYAEAVEEALCYGWVDSRPNKLDAGALQAALLAAKAKEPLVHDQQEAGPAPDQRAADDASWPREDRGRKERRLLVVVRRR